MTDKSEDQLEEEPAATERIVTFFQQAVFPSCTASNAQRILKNKREQLKTKSYELAAKSGEEQADFLQEIEEYHRTVLERRKAIDDKAKANLIAIGLSITLSFSSLSYAKDFGNSPFEYFCRALLAIGAMYLIASGHAVIKAFNVKEYYDRNLQEIIDEASGKITLKKAKPSEQIIQHYRFIQLNENINIEKNNFVYSSLSNIRNGLILIAIFFLISIAIIKTAPKGALGCNQEQPTKIEKNTAHKAKSKQGSGVKACKRFPAEVIREKSDHEYKRNYRWYSRNRQQ